MNMVFSDIGLTTDVTLISVGNMSPSTKDIYTLFDSLAQAGVDVDMISQPASWGSDISLSFTVDDHALSDVVLGLGALKKRYPNIRTDINSGNFKLHFTAEEMLGKPGVTAYLLGLFCKADIDVKMISTSEIDISLLIDSAHYSAALQLLETTFDKVF